MKNSGFSIIKSIANLKISWSFLLEKILRSTRTLDCDKYRLKLKGRFFSFCWAIFLYFSTPISWVMIRNVIKSTFCGHFASSVASSVVIDKPLVDTLLINQDFSQNRTYRQRCSIVDKSKGPSHYIELKEWMVNEWQKSQYGQLSRRIDTKGHNRPVY